MRDYRDHVCAYIPNNTAPDESVTEASAGLTTLAHGLAENSGVDTSLTNWFDSMFGKWKKYYDHCIMGYIHLCDCFSFMGLLSNSLCTRPYSQDSGEIDDNRW